MNENQRYHLDEIFNTLQDIYRAIEAKDLDSYNQAIISIADSCSDLTCLDASEVEVSND